MFDHFYRDLAPFEHFGEVAVPSSHASVPDDWHVALADVVDSTGAIESGAYREVNAVGVACIVAGLKASPVQDIPYVFGGDGAFLVVPERAVDPIGEALAYGIHTLDAALMTCMVRNMSGDHVHFVDGADGGYAAAAEQLKRQLRAHSSS